MEQSRFVIAIAVLMLSACGNKSEKEPTVAPVSPPLVEHNTPTITDPSTVSPTEDKVPEMSLPASTVVTPTPPEQSGKPTKTNDDIKDELVSPKKEPSLKQNSPVTTGQPVLTPTKEKGLEKKGLESADTKPASPTKTEMPLTVNKSKEGRALSREAGLTLAKQNGCLVCHKIEAKLVGPAWQDVSKRYKGDPDAKASLIAKVKTGGKGNWTKETGGIPMPPYSPRVSDEDIEKLVTFVLSL